MTDDVDELREILRSTARHRDRLEGAVESAVSDLRVLAPRLEGGNELFAREVAQDLEAALEGEGDELEDVEEAVEDGGLP